MLGITFEETQFYKDIRRDSKEEEAQSLVLRLLTRRVGELSPQVREKVEKLSLEQLENLGEALLDFNSMGDLQAWLDGNG